MRERHTRRSVEPAHQRRRDEAGVMAKFGVAPASIPDYLALVGDSADGYPGLPGWGAKSSAAVLARYHLPRPFRPTGVSGASMRPTRPRSPPRSPASAIAPSCSAISRRCARTFRCSPTSTNCAGRTHRRVRAAGREDGSRAPVGHAAHREAAMTGARCFQRHSGHFEGQCVYRRARRSGENPMFFSLCLWLLIKHAEGG